MDIRVTKLTESRRRYRARAFAAERRYILEVCGVSVVDKSKIIPGCLTSQSGLARLVHEASDPIDNKISFYQHSRSTTTMILRNLAIRHGKIYTPTTILYELN